MTEEQTAAARPPTVPRRRTARPPLGEKLAEELLRDIVAGRYGPGDALPTELQLAAHSGLSRLTVREAIGLLRQKSVVEIRRGRGTYVRPREDWSPLDPSVLEARVSEGDGLATMEHLLEARRLVEVGVAELAAARRNEADLTRLQEALATMRRAGGDLEVFVEGDLAFHDALLKAAGNPVISALFTPVGELLATSRRSTSRRAPDRAEAIAAHEEILDAVVRKDPSLARTAMSDHLLQTEAIARSGRRSNGLRRAAPSARTRPLIRAAREKKA